MERLRTKGHSQHFVMKHRMYLERKIMDIDSILHDLLENNLIKKEQHDDIICNFPNQQKMKELYQYVKLWDKKKKDRFYEILRKHYNFIIADMEMAEKRLIHGFRPLSPDIEAFLSCKRWELVDKVTLVDPVLDDLLDQDVLEEKQYYWIKNCSSHEGKMRELLNIASSWGDYSKYLLYQALCKHNTLVIRDLESSKNTKPGSTQDTGESNLTPARRVTVDSVLDAKLPPLPDIVVPEQKNLQRMESWLGMNAQSGIFAKIWLV